MPPGTLAADDHAFANGFAFEEAATPEAALAALRAHPLGAAASVAGRVVAAHPGLVVLRTRLGGSRVVDLLPGDQLPRIC